VICTGLQVLKGRSSGLVVAANLNGIAQCNSAIAFDSRVPHWILNDGDHPLRVFSVYWAPHARIA
jgi:oxalate decarboxylase/phosphoglucose isomerase-like protein (cupin superfamily)